MKPSLTLRLRRHAGRATLIALLAVAAPAAAQDTQTNTTLPQTIPGLGNFSIAPRDRLSPAPLPSPSPTPTPAPSTAPASRTPIAPPPRLTIEPLPTPTPSATARRARPTPTPTPGAMSQAVPSRPAAVPSPNIVATPAATATPAIAPTPTAPSAAAAPPTPVPSATAARPSKVWIVVLLVMLLLPGAVIVAYFYRRSLAAGGPLPDALDDEDDDWVAPPPPAPTQPAAPAAPVARRTPGSGARPQLDIAFAPRRAGTNLTSAAVDYELVVRNTGTAPAHGVRLAVDLITAGNNHDSELQTLFDHAVQRPIVAPFDLAPGEHKGVKAMALLPKEAINVVSVKGRPMFVPMVAVNVLYDWRGGSGQTASSHVIGIARAEGERMRPFWLDQTQRMYEGVSQRAHAVTVRR